MTTPNDSVDLAPRWQALVAALRDGMVKRGRDVALLDASEETRLIRVPIGDGEFWEYPVARHNLARVDPSALASEILVALKTAELTKANRPRS
jgi:hypothetical protein